MEYYGGGTLRDRLNKCNGPIPLDDAIKYIKDLSRAVETANAKGILYMGTLSRKMFCSMIQAM